jgi:hypothetical protein
MRVLMVSSIFLLSLRSFWWGYGLTLCFVGRAAAIAADKASFDLCDDAEGLDGGREVGLSISENKFGYTAPVKDEAPPAPTTEIKVEVPMETPKAEVNGVVA